MKTYYTALGHLLLKHTNSGQQFPVIVVNQEEYPIDQQELILWSRLCWHILEYTQLENQYHALVNSIYPPRRTFENGLNRLMTRGLVISGTGQTDSDALYGMLAPVFVVPASSSLVLRIYTLLKLLLVYHEPFSKAKVLLERDHPSARELHILQLSRQTPLSTAELVKCFDLNVYRLHSTDHLLNTLYGDTDTTCDNIADLMYVSKNRSAVTEAVSNLYLRKQVVLERVAPE